VHWMSAHSYLFVASQWTTVSNVRENSLIGSLVNSEFQVY
jgi:hypothetical protein